ncbi:MAG TPA: nicotinamide riboside transporter PnuC [Bacteroidia bacterium]|nr:nicotinamide riboside transporter PnuC [Bacteroidia bacterium]
MKDSTGVLFSVFSSIRQTGFPELIAIITALIYVVLAARANKWCWIFGIVSSAIYVWFFFVLTYYYDAFLNVYYVVIGFYGWYAWTRKKAETEESLPIYSADKRTLLLLIATGAAATLLLGWGGPRLASFFAEIFHADVPPFKRPYVDAMLTSFSLVATWMTTRKMIENWIFWVVIDAGYVIVCLISERPSTALLMFIYTIIAIFGYFRWKKTMPSGA